MLKESSFTKASSLNSNKKIPSEKNLEKKSIPITSGNDGKIIANAFVSPEQVEIILENDMEEMKKRDMLDADKGRIQKDSIIDYVINKNGSDIREIIIKNYKEKERVNEIINTAGWSLTRMLENIKK